MRERERHREMKKANYHGDTGRTTILWSHLRDGDSLAACLDKRRGLAETPAYVHRDCWREAAWMDGSLSGASERPEGRGGCRRERERDASQMAELLGGRASRASRRRCDVPRWMLQCERVCMQAVASKATRKQGFSFR